MSGRSQRNVENTTRAHPHALTTAYTHGKVTPKAYAVKCGREGGSCRENDGAKPDRSASLQMEFENPAIFDWCSTYLVSIIWVGKAKLHRLLKPHPSGTVRGRACILPYSQKQLDSQTSTSKLPPSHLSLYTITDGISACHLLSHTWATTRCQPFDLKPPTVSILLLYTCFADPILHKWSAEIVQGKHARIELSHFLACINGYDRNTK